MHSGVNNRTLFSATAKKFVYKLRAYSGYLCGLVVAQLIVAAMLLLGSANFGIGTDNLLVNFHTYSPQISLVFTVAWAFIVSLLISSRRNKEASFSFPGSRLSDSLSDIAFMLTACLYGGMTTALFGAALRIKALFFTGQVIITGFYPAFGDLCAIAAAVFLYMLLVSAAGYLAGTLIRASKANIFLIAAIIALMFVPVSSSDFRLIWEIIGIFLFGQKSVGLFALLAAAVSVLFLSLSTVIANRLEVRK